MSFILCRGGVGELEWRPKLGYGGACRKRTGVGAVGWEPEGGRGWCMGPWGGGGVIRSGSLLARQNGSSLNLGKLVSSHAKWGWQYSLHDVGVIRLTNIY